MVGRVLLLLLLLRKREEDEGWRRCDYDQEHDHDCYYVDGEEWRRSSS